MRERAADLTLALAANERGPRKRPSESQQRLGSAKRMKGLEPSTFCMAKGSGGLTTPDATYGIRAIERNRPGGVMHRRAVSSRRT